VWETYAGSNLCTIKNNIITQNEVGIYLSSGDSCIISHNIIISNGIGIDAIYCDRTIITRNLIKENSEEGIFLEDSDWNVISKNNFIGNRKHAGFLYDRFSLNNRWLNNYWGEPTPPPKIIRGIVRKYHTHGEYDDYSWNNYDWNPAEEPFDIYTVENKDSDDWGFGFILCYASIEYAELRHSIWLPWEMVECIDLETGNVVRQERTGLFGFCLFKYLPMGRDYKLTISTEEGSDSIIVRDLLFLKRVGLRITVY